MDTTLTQLPPTRLPSLEAASDDIQHNAIPPQKLDLSTQRQEQQPSSSSEPKFQDVLEAELGVLKFFLSKFHLNQLHTAILDPSFHPLTTSHFKNEKLLDRETLANTLGADFVRRLEEYQQTAKQSDTPPTTPTTPSSSHNRLSIANIIDNENSDSHPLLDSMTWQKLSQHFNSLVFPDPDDTLVANMHSFIPMAYEYSSDFVALLLPDSSCNTPNSSVVKLKQEGWLQSHPLTSIISLPPHPENQTCKSWYIWSKKYGSPSNHATQIIIDTHTFSLFEKDNRAFTQALEDLWSHNQIRKEPQVKLVSELPEQRRLSNSWVTPIEQGDQAENPLPSSCTSGSSFVPQSWQSPSSSSHIQLPPPSMLLKSTSPGISFPLFSPNSMMSTPPSTMLPQPQMPNSGSPNSPPPSSVQQPLSPSSSNSSSSATHGKSPLPNLPHLLGLLNQPHLIHNLLNGMNPPNAASATAEALTAMANSSPVHVQQTEPVNARTSSPPPVTTTTAKVIPSSASVAAIVTPVTNHNHIGNNHSYLSYPASPPSPSSPPTTMDMSPTEMLLNAAEHDALEFLTQGVNALNNKKLNWKYVTYRPGDNRKEMFAPVKQGSQLLLAKQKHSELSRSEWSAVLPFSATTAYRRMRIAKHVEKYPEIATMTQEKALKYLTKKRRQEKAEKAAQQAAAKKAKMDAKQQGLSPSVMNGTSPHVTYTPPSFPLSTAAFPATATVQTE